MGTELNTYQVRTNDRAQDLEALKDLTKTLGYVVTVAKPVVGKLKKADENADKASQGLDKTELALGVLGFVSPLKTPVKILKKVLTKVEKPVDKIDEKFDKPSGKDDASTPAKEDDGEFLENLETNLERVDLAIAGVVDSLTLKKRQLEIASEATFNFKGALATATATGEVWSGRYTALDLAVEAQMAARNALHADVEALYNSVTNSVNSFFQAMLDVDFDNIFDGIVKLDDIGAIFRFLEKPLDVAVAIINPIKPLLNAVDFFIGLIIDPIIDFVLDTLGIDDLINNVAKEINKLLPSIDILYALLDLSQQIQDFLLEYAVTALCTLNLLDQI